MPVFRDFTIEWGGAPVTITPSNRLLRRIEDEVSITQFAAKCMSGGAPLADLSLIASTLLRSAGVEVTEDEMYSELHHGDPEDVVKFANQVMTAISPQPPDEKKLGGHPAAKAQKRKNTKK